MTILMKDLQFMRMCEECNCVYLEYNEEYEEDSELCIRCKKEEASDE